MARSAAAATWLTSFDDVRWGIGPGVRPGATEFRAVARAQQARLILEVTAADLEVAEAAFGPFHEVSRSFREAWYGARRAFDRVRAELGSAHLAAALEEPPRTVLALGPGVLRPPAEPDGSLPPPPPVDRRVFLLLIAGQIYGARRWESTPLAPWVWQLTRLRTSPAYDHEPPRVRSRSKPRPKPRDDAASDADVHGEEGPYVACRLRDGTTQCDCAEWVFRLADPEPGTPAAEGPGLCKHLAGLAALGWL